MRFPPSSVIWYILDGRTPVPTEDMARAAGLLASTTDRTVACTPLPNGVEVSTVFLCLDHNYTGTGLPLLFETMIFGLEDEEPQWRYATWAEAEAGHAAAVGYARTLLTPSVCPAGSLCEVCLDAPATLLQAAPWGGEMGVCQRCLARP